VLEHYHALELRPLRLPVPMVGGTPEEAHEIVTGTTRAHQLTQDPPGKHRSRGHRPLAGYARNWLSLRVGGPQIHRTGSFRDGDPRSTRILPTGDANTAGGTR